jgi:ribose 5-phosphate isomerase B
MADVVIACDHAAFDFKNQIKEHLIHKGLDVLDVGTHRQERCDYPDFAAVACAKIHTGEATWGLLLCGTGVGMSMSANRCTGIRAAVVSDSFSAAATRQHNNANVLCLGSRVVGMGLALQIIDAWCGASFEGGRHQARIDKMMNLNEKERS